MNHHMSFQQLKWLILTVPTITIGIWELVRHQFLLPYISMELGNWLSPLLVFLVTMTLLRKLFGIYDEMHQELVAQQAAKAALEERERMIQTLHDDIAQSLFLVSVQLEGLEQAPDDSKKWAEVKKNLRQVHDDVRQAIADLRKPTGEEIPNWQQMFKDLVYQFERETGIRVFWEMSIDEHVLETREKVALTACLREALMNVRKHAKASHVWVKLVEDESHTGWKFSVQDDGTGLATHNETGFPYASDALGLTMMKERADALGWEMWWGREDARTILKMSKLNKTEG